MYAPNNDVIFRANDNYNKYLGVLIGKKLEFEFDAIFTEEDLAQVNELRNLMNEALTSDGIKEIHPAPLKRLLLMLVTRRRASLKPRPIGPAFRWKSNSGQTLNYSAETCTYKLNQDIENQHDFIEFADDEEDDDLPVSTLMFPPISGIHPPLKEGVDYDSEDEIRQSRLRKLELLNIELFGDNDESASREEPEVFISIGQFFLTLMNPNDFHHFTFFSYLNRLFVKFVRVLFLLLKH